MLWTLIRWQKLQNNAFNNTAAIKKYEDEERKLTNCHVNFWYDQCVLNLTNNLKMLWFADYPHSPQLAKKEEMNKIINNWL